ncbi:SidA/IucD/PvdA family monooxygenase [Bacillus altitudinis]|uniref:lysine N(6)-hydroxylase/L-ornithine N(5)-oxygenase family protein n=1 Tax=Bacillus TaxID=1386 RepID=UPI00071D6B1E|nr:MULTISPECIES: SidA/IucD/PvdA family monooxygenase [Bacillus]KSU71628.1 ornithine monooxygenase [Bacillus altitudinis]MBW3701237.1 ornithine monooxygenase [Bacillus aerophilus]MCA0117606.1 SidA/IucD/PvdA family monooxygenase [Bacillus sp. RSS_NA_20]SPR94950.1 Lysine ornithine n-monooxygenase [Bacillus altitudinis]
MMDVIGIGIGPANLGLAALLEEYEDVTCCFFEQESEFAWHPGMLIKGTDLQVSFLADLVTMANPRSKYTFLNYLHESNRLHRFYTFEQFDIPRREFNEYLSWVAGELDSCQFGMKVEEVTDCEDGYLVKVRRLKDGALSEYRAKHVVLGTGSKPMIPVDVPEAALPHVTHSSRYVDQQKELHEAETVAVIGSGQSAAEIFLDLLQHQKKGQKLSWFTRSSEFRELETAELGQELFTPKYVEYFHSLPYEERMNTLPRLAGLRNGIDASTLSRIYQELYHRSVSGEEPSVLIQPMTELEAIHMEDEQQVELHLKQWQLKKEKKITADHVVLATGYTPNIPEWFSVYEPLIEWESDKHFKVTDDFRLVFKDKRSHHFFTFTNLDHSHGTAATNLKLSIYRNQKVIRTIRGDTKEQVKQETAFQQFE